MRRFGTTRRARLRRAATSACLTALLCAFGAGGVARAADPVPTALPATPASEAEPNDSLANASDIASGERVRGSVFPAGDVDLYRFTAEAGDRVFATAITGGSAGHDFAADAQLRVLDSTGALIEFDDDDGVFTTLSPSIAGATIPASGTYFLDVREFSASETIVPYDLLLDVRSGPAAPEAEPNDGPAEADPLGGGFVAGARAAGDQDWYALELDAGDTVFLSLDLDPDRDGVVFNGRLAFGAGADALAVVDDQGNPGHTGDFPSEAYVTTVRAAGTYYVRVNSGDAAAAGTYELSATVIPAVQRSCRTYAVTPSPGTIPDAGVVTFPIEVADAATIDHVALALDITHARMSDLDMTLQAPTGNRIALVTDIGSNAANSPTRMQVLFDDDAGLPPHSLALMWPSLQLEPREGRLSYFSGQPAAGTWNLTIYDDIATSVGTLARAELILCARPDEGPTETVFSAGFESSDDGFTHSGAADEWERGLPATPQIPGGFNTVALAGLASCAEGTGCFKTDLDGTYESSSSQDLVSPPISLVGRTGPIYASWAMWYQIEGAFDHATVSVEEDGGGNPRPLFTWAEGSMFSEPIGPSPMASVPFAAGWGAHRADISAYAGRTIRLRFHLDSDDRVNVSGMAIDDVRVYQPMFALDVAVAGSGSGYVDSSPTGIDCGTDMAAHPTCSVARAGSVTLTAHPAADSTFAGFTGGGCSGAAPCTVSLDQARRVTARFDLRPHPPTVPPPPGAAPSSPPGTAPSPPAAAEPPISRLWLAPRCVRRSPSGRVRIRMIMRQAQPGPLRIRIDRAVGSKSRRSCPRPNPARHRKTRFKKVTTVRSAPTGVIAASVPRQVTLHLRLRPGLYRLTVRAQLEGGRLSPPLRRFMRVVG